MTETTDDETEISMTAEDREVQPTETVVTENENEKETVTTDAMTETAGTSVTIETAKNVPMVKTENLAKRTIPRLLLRHQLTMNLIPLSRARGCHSI